MEVLEVARDDGRLCVHGVSTSALKVHFIVYRNMHNLTHLGNQKAYKCRWCHLVKKQPCKRTKESSSNFLH